RRRSRRFARNSQPRNSSVAPVIVTYQSRQLPCRYGHPIGVECEACKRGALVALDRLGSRPQGQHAVATGLAVQVLRLRIAGGDPVAVRQAPREATQPSARLRSSSRAFALALFPWWHRLAIGPQAHALGSRLRLRELVLPTRLGRLLASV